MLIGISPLQDKMRAVNGPRISCITPYIYTSISAPLSIIGMDIEEGGSWDPAFLVETSSDTSSVQTVTGAQEDELLMETGESGLEVVDPTIINKPSSSKEKGVPGKEKEVAAPPRCPGTTPRGPNFEKNQRKREKRQRLNKRTAEAAGTEWV
jgi:hypothetical protein